MSIQKIVPGFGVTKSIILIFKVDGNYTSGNPEGGRQKFLG
jgi:hypothetical protein